jgi:hypothetical protein
MRHKRLIVPVGAAVAALLAYVSYAGEVSAEAQQDSSEQGNRIQISKTSIDPVLQRLMYQIGEQTHDLTLHKSSSGPIYAAHGSHRSHGSHVSHRSHRSGR